MAGEIPTSPTPQEGPRVRVVVSPRLEVVGLSGEKLQALYRPDPNIDPKAVYDPTTYPALRAINEVLKKKGVKGRVNSMVRGKVFELTHEDKMSDEEALVYTRKIAEAARDVQSTEVRRDFLVHPILEEVTAISIVPPSLMDESKTL